MSFPNIPNITPSISVTVEQTIPLLLSSIALEELALAHLINAEAEKLQLVLGTLPGGTPLTPAEVSVSNLLAVDASVQRTLRDVIKKEMLLEFKFQNILDLIAITPLFPPPVTTISVTAEPTVICATGTGTGPFVSSLTGQVLVNGVAAPIGTQVNFSVNPALGIVAPNPAFTGPGGFFDATFTSTGGTGQVTITASLPAFPGVTAGAIIDIIDCTPPDEGCGCQVSGMPGAGNDFTINRGVDNPGSGVTFNGVDQDPTGGVNYNGLICSDCETTDNFFTFVFDGSANLAAFTFEADTFVVPNCPGEDSVIITGQGTITAGTNVFGATPTYTLTVNEVTTEISVTISGNGNTFTSTVTNVGGGEIDLTNCP